MAYYGRQRAYTNVSAVVEDFIRVSEARMLGVMRQAIQDVVINAQTPKAKGGKMRVDTGFLRASGRASLEGWPRGNGERPADAPVGQYTGVYDNFDGVGAKSVTAVLIDMKLGDTFYFGWVANYAPHREIYDGFMESSLQNWSRYVAFATDTVKQRIK